MLKAWSDEAWNDYMYWYNQGDKAKFKKINKLIKDIERTPFEGIGKPEPLRFDLNGKWSRRIDGEHRLIYTIENDTIFLYSAKEHY